MENVRNDNVVAIIAVTYLLLKMAIVTIVLACSTKLSDMNETTSKSADGMTWKQVIAWIVGTLILMGGAVYAAYKTTEHHRPSKQQHEDSLKAAKPSYGHPDRSGGKGKGLLHGLHVSLPELPGLPGIKINVDVRLV